MIKTNGGSAAALAALLCAQAGSAAVPSTPSSSPASRSGGPSHVRSSKLGTEVRGLATFPDNSEAAFNAGTPSGREKRGLACGCVVDLFKTARAPSRAPRP